MKRNAAIALVCVAMIALLSGCVRRRIRMTSIPPGALVHLNGVQIGRTPVEAAFKFYGVYDIRLELEGHEPMHESREAGAPFWEWPGVDPAATLTPLDLDHVVDWHFTLDTALERTMPAENAAQEVGRRARELRDQIVASEASRAEPS